MVVFFTGGIAQKANTELASTDEIALQNSESADAAHCNEIPAEFIRQAWPRDQSSDCAQCPSLQSRTSKLQREITPAQIAAETSQLLQHHK
jgi:hypothetical protein